MATTTERTWQAGIIDALGDEQLADTIADDHTHAAVWVPDDVTNEEAELLGTANGELAAVVIAEDKGATRTAGEARVVKLDDLYAWHRDHSVVVDGPKVEPRRQNIETEEPEHVDDDTDENDENDDDVEETVAAAPGEQVQAFDASDYDREDLQIPKVDGESIDKIAIEFKGRVLLDRSDPADVAMYNRMKLGAEVELRVAGKVSGVGTGFTTNRDGDLDVVVGKKKLSVESVWVLTPEQLGTPA